jgi:hypothetical protein
MTLISKAQAGFVSGNYIATLADRVDAFLRSQASRGIVGGQFFVDPPSVPTAGPVQTALQAAGWTVSFDAPSSIATIS